MQPYYSLMKNYRLGNTYIKKKHNGKLKNIFQEVNNRKKSEIK